jgi:hypothetical protein
MLRAYASAWEAVENATQVIEDESIMVSDAGEKFVQPSRNLVSQMNDVCAALKVWVNRFESEADVEKEG